MFYLLCANNKWKRREWHSAQTEHPKIDSNVAGLARATIRVTCMHILRGGHQLEEYKIQWEHVCVRNLPPKKQEKKKKKTEQNLSTINVFRICCAHGFENRGSREQQMAGTSLCRKLQFFGLFFR